MRPTDLPQSEMEDDNADASPAMLAAATLFMMTRFAEAPSAEAAAEVVQHLEIVAEDERGDPLMREVANALAQRWQGHAGHLCPALGATAATLHH